MYIVCAILILFSALTRGISTSQVSFIVIDLALCNRYCEWSADGAGALSPAAQDAKVPTWTGVMEGVGGHF